jgi:hypothetical protein
MTYCLPGSDGSAVHAQRHIGNGTTVTQDWRECTGKGADRKFKRPFGTTPAGAPQRPTARRRVAQRGLNMLRRMGAG